MLRSFKDTPVLLVRSLAHTREFLLRLSLPKLREFTDSPEALQLVGEAADAVLRHRADERVAVAASLILCLLGDFPPRRRLLLEPQAATVLVGAVCRALSAALAVAGSHCDVHWSAGQWIVLLHERGTDAKPLGADRDLQVQFAVSALRAPVPTALTSGSFPLVRPPSALTVATLLFLEMLVGPQGESEAVEAGVVEAVVATLAAGEEPLVHDHALRVLKSLLAADGTNAGAAATAERVRAGGAVGVLVADLLGRPPSSPAARSFTLPALRDLLDASPRSRTQAIALGAGSALRRAAAADSGFTCMAHHVELALAAMAKPCAPESPRKREAGGGDPVLANIR